MARRSTRKSTNHTILVVDDQDDTLISVRSLLEREGHRVLVAESGERGLDVLKQADVDLIIVDYCMPRMSGAQFVREVRRFDPFVQIILQTGYAGDEPPRTMLAELDIQGYHYKADDPERLLLWVDVALKTHRLVAHLRDRERLQKDMVANCSHEFRTPLNIILGYAELMRGTEFGELPQGAIAPIKAIDAAARTLSNMVTDFLQCAKLDAGVRDAARDAVDVTEFAREMERLAVLLLEDRPVTFVLELDAAPSHVVTDAVKLRTIVRNLVTNAVKFTATGTIALRIAARAGTVRFDVRDTGPGIRPEDHELVFEAFRQLDGSSTRAHGGVGLGLALCRKLARTLAGELQLESVPGKGSTFTLVLPLPGAATGAAASRLGLAGHA